MAGCLYLTRGLPGSGKSTWAKRWVAARPNERVAVSRDGLRDGLWRGAYQRSETFELAVTTAQRGMVASLLSAGYHVVVDDTNAEASVVEAWCELALANASDFMVVDFSNVPIDVCIARDARRTRHDWGGVDVFVGEDAIRRIHNQMTADGDDVAPWIGDV